MPSNGAIILVAAPHANQFVDSLVLMRVMRSLSRRISWLMAAKSFSLPIVGPLATGVGALPVSRVMDNAKAADGTVYLPDPIADPKLLRGVGTRFDDPAFQIGGSIYLPSVGGESHKLVIAEIRGADEILLKIAPTTSDVLLQLSDPVGTKFKVAPHIDQTQVYEAVFECLQKQGCVGIFPEGGSHDRSDLLPLKAGISIMALGALAQKINVTVVPVGLNYFHAHKFRSRAVVEFGDPVHVPSELVQSYIDGKRRESVGDLLASIYQSLTAVTMTAPDFDTMKLVHAARRLYIPRHQRVPLSTVIEVNRRLVKGYTQHKSDPEIQNLSKSVKNYNDQLELLGIKDHQLKYAHFSVLRVLSSLLYRAGKLTILTIGTLPGLALFSPVFIVARIYSHKKKREALAGSTVKIQGNDVMATWKILVAGGLAPLLYTYYAIILAIWTHYNHMNGLLPETISIRSVVVGAYVIFPMLTYAALRLGEVGMDILKSLWPLMLCLSPRSSSTLVKLREERAYLARRVTTLINTLGPDLFPDCDAAKLPQPRRLYSDVSPYDTLDDLAGTEFF